MDTMTWSEPNDPTSWDITDALPFKFFSSKDAIAAARYFNEYKKKLVADCAALCRAQIQTGPSTSLIVAAQNTMAAQCAEEIERAFGLEDTPK